jgi:hypothetical protein
MRSPFQSKGPPKPSDVAGRTKIIAQQPNLNARAGAVEGGIVEGEEVAGDTAAAGAGLSAGVAAGIATAGALLVIGGIAGGVAAVFIGDDNKTREAYTQNFVAQASKQFPNCNHVVCHPQHRVAGPQVVHTHYELAMKVGTCGYDIYSSPMGQPFIFENQGDGGYLNWAYAGEFSRSGNTLTAASKLPTPKFS